MELFKPLVTWSCIITWQTKTTISLLPQCLRPPNFASWWLVKLMKAGVFAKHSALVSISMFFALCFASRLITFSKTCWRLFVSFCNVLFCYFVCKHKYTLKCWKNRGVKIKGKDRRFLLNLINRGVKINGGGLNFRKSINIGNEWKKRHKCLILMLKLKISKRTRSEASKNKVSNNQKGIKHINKLSKSK